VSPCASIQEAVERGSHDLQSGAAGSLLIEVAPGFYSGDVRIPVLPGTEPVTIQGAGPSSEVGGLGDGPAVTVPAGSRVAITDLSITGGRAASGGGVNNAGTLTLQRISVFFNSATNLPSDTVNTGLGGGIFNTGSLTLQDSTVSNNQASVAGGGIENHSSGILSAARDAIVNNTVGPSGCGAGLDFHAVGGSYVDDSTIAGNSVQGEGYGVAGVCARLTPVRLYGDTIANNHSAGVGGLAADQTTVDIGGTLLAQNTPQDCVVLAGSIALNGGDLADDSSCGAEVSGLDPQLQPLANNGGPTQTMAIAASSPAYDSSPLCASTDQRAVSRLQLGAARCDIGAYQVSAPSTYVANPAAGSVTAYAVGAAGDAAPTLALAGPSTGLSRPGGWSSTPAAASSSPTRATTRSPSTRRR
jgi:hypothetical protein